MVEDLRRSVPRSLEELKRSADRQIAEAHKAVADARRIVQESAEVRAESQRLRCQECALLCQKHADAGLTHANLRDQLSRAVRDSKGEMVTALIMSEAAALKERESAEAALRKHEAAAHRGGDAQAQAV